MFKIINKIVGFIKSLFYKNVVEETDELLQIGCVIERLSRKLKSLGCRQKIMEETVALRHINIMRRSLNIMMKTTEPEIFSAKYTDLYAFAKSISKFEYIDERARGDAREIIVMLDNMRTQAPETSDDMYVYYSVTFGGRKKEYYYLSGGKKYKTGQYVLAPVNYDMEIKVVKIVSVDVFTKTNAPMPPDKLKSIISRAMATPV